MKKHVFLGLGLFGITALLAACGQQTKAATTQRTLNVAVSTEAEFT
ncbi:oligopeptide ABC transporter periplasmic protein [Lacticaseibacillus paracasei subsp. paracasei Lpp126]|uniref:Oligopeptide ABC transporter periplasmic protein n=1 Tax=Lacticaseibacillus paracasei subsp. paracasei Lpp126 TaxID=1256206 RepID=S2RMU1_LACPA|nr:oligopeptide ABC transporter periplasmic protein [Lacticaseibacillus paracasei subsp. paracasei Lpp126]